MIGTIGNKIWNYATDNKDKIIFNIDSTSFNDSIREKLENAGMNYYCVTNGKNARIAINTSDKDILKSIFDNDTYSSITFTKPQKDYTPDSNKIGNSKHIPEKCYYWMNKDMALSIADYLEKQGIPYSGILYTNNTKIKLSVSAENAPLMRRCIKNAKQQRIHFLNELYSVAEYNYFNRQVKLNSFDMPDVLLGCGLNARPMHYTNGLNETQLHRLPSLLENPVMVYRSLKQNDNIVVVTSDMDSHNNPIIVSISPDKNGDYKFERVNSTFATTSKGRNIFANHIAKEINSGNMLFTDKEKKQDLYNALNLQLSDISENINNDEIADNVPEQVEQTNVSENTENSVISDFREKTEELFHDVNGYKPDVIELSVQNYILEKLEQNNINASLDNVILTGSRSRGLERSDSDIDVVAEISSPDLKEDALFNILNEEPMDIDGIKIDINPIRKEETGTLESYLPMAEKYLTEKRAAKEQVEEKEEEKIKIENVDKFVYNPDTDSVTFIYFNADGNNGHGQLIETTIYADDVINAEKTSNSNAEFLDSIYANGKSVISDFGTDDFNAALDYFNNNKFDFVAETNNTNEICNYLRKQFVSESQSIKADSPLKAAFEKLISNHDFPEKTLILLDRIERQMNANGYSTLTPELLHLPIFATNYGKVTRINSEFFNENLRQIMAELNGYIEDLSVDKTKSDQIHSLGVVFGLDENLLKSMVQLNLTEANIDEFGRFDKLKQSVNKDNAKAFFEKIEGTTIIPPKVNMKVDKVLRNFILNNDTDIVSRLNGYIESLSDEPVAETEVDKFQEFKIYQMKAGEEYHYNRFESLEMNKGKVNISDYDEVYFGFMGDYAGSNINEKLESIYTEFNKTLPENFSGHSLSMSDVIVTEDNKAYYVDRSGFNEFPEFFKEKTLEVVEETNKEENIAKETPQIKDDKEPDINTNIKQWYMQEFPTDTLGESIDDTITFKDVQGKEGKEFYDTIGFGDSVVRERIQEKLSDINSARSEQENARTVDDIAIGDKYLLKDSFDEKEVTVTSMMGIYSNDVGITQHYNDNGMEYDMTSNIDKYKLHNNGIYLGNENDTPEKEQKSVKMTLYHGTRAEDFDRFKLDYRGAVWTDSDMEHAVQYAGNSPESKVLTCETELQNPAHFSYGSHENWDIDKTIREAKTGGHDSAVIDFKFIASDNSYFKIMLENYPENSAKETLGKMPDASADDALEGETVAEFAERMKKSGNITHTFVAIFNPDAIKIINRKTVYEPEIQEDNTEKSPFIISPNVEAELQTQQIENLSKENLENSNSEKQNQNDVNNTKTQEEDVPLFNDEAVFEEIEKAEKSKEDKEIQNTNTYGEQLSLFGNNEPLNTSTAATTKDKSKSEFSPGPIVDGVQVYEALAEEIDFGTGVEHGKIRIQNFYDEKQPSLNELANFMKKEYGIGGHSGNGNIFSVDHDSHGITFTFENGEKFRHSWYNVAVMTETRLSNDTYLSAEQKVERAEQLKNSVTDKIENNEIQNFTITDNTLGEGGAKTKFKNNIAAIETLKTLEKENRPANDEEKELLSKYVGWGGIAQAFDKDNKAWENEYSKLKSVLDDKEYKEARSSVLDSYFTAPAIIDGIYEALNQFGFKGGNVLEPSMGVGNFFGRMPTEMQKNSNLYGIEIDGISGRIAKKLYPNADISVMGFEENSFQNGCFDVAVGNVPFGKISFKDDKHHTTKLHDYFFAETLDKVKNGGIIAFVTSAGTLDKRDESTRKALSEKADFIGAVRLPGGKNGAFKNNAGTEVTTDIIFLQKNDNKPVKAEKESWVSIGETADGLPVNNYFAENPDMVLGKIVEGNKLYGSGTMVIAEDNFDLNAELSQAVKKLSAKISDEKTKDVYSKSNDGFSVKIPSELRNYSYFEQNNKIYFKANNSCRTFDKNDNQYDRFKAFIELRDTMREVLEAQELDKPDEVIKSLQAKLNKLYDNFYKKYGLIHSQKNKNYFSKDISYNLVSGLEEKFEKNKLIEKSDIFTKRTIRPPKPIEHCETALEALTLSISEKAKVDFEYMGNLTGMTEDELKKGLVGEIYKVPHTKNTYQTASEYLSGDIRAKLKAAKEVAEYDSDFNVNVNVLKNALPEPLKAGDIDVKIGTTWIDPKYYEQFLYETLKTPKNNRNDVKHFRWQKTSLIEIEYSEHTSNWRINNKSFDNSVISTQQYGSKRMNAYEIMEHLLNLKEPKVYKTIMVPDGMGDVKEKRVVDVDATRVVQQKADRIKKEFKKWIFKDPERRKNIVNRYNELFNSIRPREYDGSNLSFPMMNTDIKLHDHQKNAIAHAMFGGNTLFAHAVGAGKTFEMIATAMESKRLGLCTKSLFAVPNHLTEQIGNDFRKLYPSANILVATKKDFQKENRQQLFAKIATGNFDAVIIGHSQLGMIPISKERQENMINSQIDDIVKGIAELRASDGSKFQVKQMERTKKSLEKNLDNLKKRHDDTITFEQLGVDKLFVDEAHEFKNLFTPTKLNNIAGISTSASQKALDLFMKCRYLDEKTGGKGVVFATGTPYASPYQH